MHAVDLERPGDQKYEEWRKDNEGRREDEE